MLVWPMPLAGPSSSGLKSGSFAGSAGASPIQIHTKPQRSSSGKLRTRAAAGMRPWPCGLWVQAPLQSKRSAW